MNSLLPCLLPVLGILFLIVRRAPKSNSESTERPDFIAMASSSRFIDDGSGIQIISKGDSTDYNYEVVGESFQRDHLMALIRVHKAFDTGEIFATAVLEPEPTNEFDSTAVKVVVEGVQVGYIAKFDSGAVTKMIKKSGRSVYEVPAKIGFDPNSPSPLIGVKLAFRIQA